MSIKTRIAPSPTGSLHIGTARTALFSWIFARQNGGKFILRIEDTDLERSDKKFEYDILEGLEWLGLLWDEGPYRQSERTDTYERYLKQLLDEKKAFWCPHSTEELATEKERQMKSREHPRHICEYREGGSDKGIIRLKNDFKETVEFDDLIRGKISFEADLMGDFSLAKDLSTPLYNFAVVIDDYEMKITHIIRGEDHISNTPRQILIQQALGISEPRYAHLPLILGKDRSKLSKRHGATSVNEYKKDGYLPEAVFNFMALLGWHPTDEREIFSQDELLREFSFERIQKGGAVFDIEKLDWVNREYIKKMPAAELAKRLSEFLPAEWADNAGNNPAFFAKVAELARERMTKLSEISDLAEYFFKEPEYPKELLCWKEKQGHGDIVRHLTKIKEIVSAMGDANFNKQSLEASILPYASAEGRGEVLWPFRVSLCGRKQSPGPFEIADALGKEKTLERLNRALEILKRVS